MSILIPILLIIGTCVIIWRASDGFETASEYLGRNLSEGVRGATINAIASSMPELFTTLFFLFVLHDQDGFAGGIGTTAGSAVFNGVIIPALVIVTVVTAGVVAGVSVSKKVVLRDGISLILAEIILILFIGGAKLDWWQGLILMGVYVVYIVYMLTSMKAPADSDEDDDDDDDDDDAEDGGFFKNLFTLNLEPIFIKGEINSGNAWALLIASTLVIGLACFLLVDSCERLGTALEIPIYFIAVILASAATSVPDTIISMRDARRGNYDDAVSNAIGSNIFDICFALGFPLFLFTLINGPIEMSPGTVENVAELRILLLGLTILAVAIFYFGKTMGIVKSAMLLGIYILFVVYIMGDDQIGGYSEGLSDVLHGIDEKLNGLRFWLD